MREFGATRLALPNGLILERPPVSPLEAAAVVAASQKKAAKTTAAPGEEPDDDEGEEAQEKALKARWAEHWQRLTLSSGAPIPSFPGREKALRMLGAQ